MSVSVRVTSHGRTVAEFIAQPDVLSPAARVVVAKELENELRLSMARAVSGQKNPVTGHKWPARMPRFRPWDSKSRSYQESENHPLLVKTGKLMSTGIVFKQATYPDVEVRVFAPIRARVLNYGSPGRRHPGVSAGKSRFWFPSEDWFGGGAISEHANPIKARRFIGIGRAALARIAVLAVKAGSR